MSQKEIISLLSREQEFKKVFLQLGNQKKIPYDILLLIYNLLRYQSQKEIESIQNSVPYGDRSNSIIEPLLTEQWFAAGKYLSKKAI